MLNFFRKNSQGIVVKVLMILLALTFVLWGVGGMLRSGNKIVAFKVGDAEYSIQDWQMMLKNHIQRLQHEAGRTFTDEEIEEWGIRDTVLTQSLNKSVLLQEAKRLGLLVNDDMVKYEIASLPQFQKDGKFSKDKFQIILRQNGLSEAKFLNMLKEDITTGNLVRTFSTDKTVSKNLIDNLLKAKGERRKSKVVRIPTSYAKVTAIPTDEELKKIQNQNLDKFSVAETRNISYVEFGIDQIDSHVDTPDSILKEQYEAKKAIFLMPEEREVHQFIFKDEEKAKEAKALIDSGDSFAKVGKKYFPDKKKFLLGTITKEGLDQKTAKAIFDLKKGNTSAPTQTPLGWHIFKVTKIIPEKTRSFAEVNGRIKKQYIEDVKFERLSRLAQDIDHEIALGNELQEVAAKFDLKIKKVFKLANNHKYKDKVLKHSTFKSVAFSTDNESTSMVTPVDELDKFFVLQVDKVNASKPKEFADIKAELSRIWKDHKKQENLKKLAHSIADELENGKSLSSVISSHKLAKAKSIEVSRLNRNASKESPQLIDEIFKIEAGKNTGAYLNTDGSYSIAKLDKIIPVELKDIESKRQLVMYELMQAQPNEVLEQYFKALKSRYDIMINYDAVKVRARN